MRSFASPLCPSRFHGADPSRRFGSRPYWRGVCRAYRSIRRGQKSEPFQSSRLPQRQEPPPSQEPSLDDEQTISAREWHVTRRVADQLFPEGLIDWKTFWTTDDYESWFDDWRRLLAKEGGLGEDVPVYEATQEGQRKWLRKARAYLQTRSDYVEMLPWDWAQGTQETEDPPSPAKEFDPDWDDMDFRAMMEKRRQRERDRRAWRRRQREELGKYKYVDTISIDMRFTDEQREAYNCTEEEAWNLITQNGRAFDPRKEKGPWEERNPEEVPDWAGEGNEYVEEIDEYMLRTGLMVEDAKYFEEQNARLEKEAEIAEAFKKGFDASE